MSEWSPGGVVWPQRSFEVRLLVGECVLANDGRIMRWTGERFEQLPGDWREGIEAAVAALREKRNP